MTRCIEEGALRAYMDDELSEQEGSQVKAHLSGCAECRGRAREMAAMAEQVRTALSASLPAPDPRSALVQLRASQQSAYLPSEQVKVRQPAGVWPLRARRAMAGLGFAVVMMAVLALALILGGRGQIASGPAQAFVPPGKVRHMVITHTYGISGQPDSEMREEVWLANGKDHLLMYSTYPSEGISTWIEEDAVYSYDHRGFPDNEVRKYPYDARHLELYTPNEISYLLRLPNAAVTGDSTLDGRPVTVIEAIADRSKLEWSPSLGGVVVTDYKLWVDKETSQVLQRQHTTTVVGDQNKGNTQTQTFRVVVNELRDRSEFPPDFFAFKPPEGATVVEAPSPFSIPEPEATAEIEKAEEPATHEAKVSPSVGERAPDFELTNVRTGEPVRLSSLRGKPVFINFWGTWCPPCRAEMPEMQRVYDQYKGQVEVIGISMAPRDSADMVKNFVDQEKYTWTFIHDESNQVQISYQVWQVPTSYFLDKNGIVRAVHIGAMNEKQIESYLEKVLSP